MSALLLGMLIGVLTMSIIKYNLIVLNGLVNAISQFDALLNILVNVISHLSMLY